MNAAINKLASYDEIVFWVLECKKELNLGNSNTELRIIYKNNNKCKTN